MTPQENAAALIEFKNENGLSLMNAFSIFFQGETSMDFAVAALQIAMKQA